MQLSEVARINIKRDSELCDTMIGNHLISQIQRETKLENSHKGVKKKKNKNSKGKY